MRSFSTLAAFALFAASVPAAHAQDAKRYFFEGDMVRHGIEGQAGPFCVLANQFKRKEGVAWRIRVLDQTGATADDKMLKTVVVELSDGQKIPASFGPHPPRGTPTDFFWSMHWVIPADYPTGSLSYKVVVTDMDGRTQTWEPFKRAPTQLTVVAGEPAMKQP
ncbi:MAG: hypothetical protein IT537_12755 [Hyphomicrobiales bacterium]|nr:hypothetical protein [Hyphomicrobiales bacterium]